MQHDCTPWVAATHPDGGLYFYDEERRLFTDTDMHNTIMREEIEHFYDFLQQLLLNERFYIPSKNCDLVLDIMVTDDERISWSYYYACHDARCLFWLETYDASYMISELFGVKSPAHVKHRLESLYWSHWSLFPVVFDGRRLSHDVCDELMGILMHGCVDFMTSSLSTLPYDDDTMRRMIRLVQATKGTPPCSDLVTSVLVNLCAFSAHWRFLCFHGQRHARLIRGQSVYDKPKRERSLLITCLSPLLFLAPDAYLREMEKLWTDEMIKEAYWKRFITKLLAQWESVILWIHQLKRSLQSTVILTANVGFLAIPGVVLSNINGSNLTSASQVTIFTSPTQIASCLSVQASIGSIVVGMPLLRRHVTKIPNDPAGASTYLDRISHSTFGLEPTAVVFSLPWALLMWSVATFYIALLLFCFTISNKATRISVAAMSVIMVVLVLWSIRALESQLAREVFYNSLAVLRRSRNRFFVRFTRLFRTRTRAPVSRGSIQMSDLDIGRV
ncbi:hypothetical protein V8E52_006259 [Russula decolorans]